MESICAIRQSHLQSNLLTILGIWGFCPQFGVAWLVSEFWWHSLPYFQTLKAGVLNSYGNRGHKNQQYNCSEWSGHLWRTMTYEACGSCWYSLCCAVLSSISAVILIFQLHDGEITTGSWHTAIALSFCVFHDSICLSLQHNFVSGISYLSVADLPKLPGPLSCDHGSFCDMKKIFSIGCSSIFRFFDRVFQMVVQLWSMNSTCAYGIYDLIL